MQGNYSLIILTYLQKAHINLQKQVVDRSPYENGGKEWRLRECLHNAPLETLTSVDLTSFLAYIMGQPGKLFFQFLNCSFMHLVVMSVCVCHEVPCFLSISSYFSIMSTRMKCKSPGLIQVPSCTQLCCWPQVSLFEGCEISLLCFTQFVLIGKQFDLQCQRPQ